MEQWFGRGSQFFVCGKSYSDVVRLWKKAGRRDGSSGHRRHHHRIRYQTFMSITGPHVPASVSACTAVITILELIDMEYCHLCCSAEVTQAHVSWAALWVRELTFIWRKSFLIDLIDACPPLPQHTLPALPSAPGPSISFFARESLSTITPALYC